MRISRRRDDRLREEIREAVLPNGMRALFLPKRGFRRKIAVFAARYGSIDLAFRAGDGAFRDTPPGIAHFLEHQLFKKEGGVDVITEFGRYGASSNAFTDYTSTAYYFTTSGDFDPGLDLLIPLVFSPYFDPEHVAKEKLIIEQEIRMYRDMPDYRAHRALLAALYREHPVRIDVGGTVESVRKIGPELLERCYGVFYHPANMVFVAAGDLDPREVFGRVAEALPPERFPGEPVADRRLPEEAAGVAEERTETKMLVSRPRVLVGLKDLGDGDLLRRDLETTALLSLLFGRGTRFYNRAYEEGLIDDSFHFSHTADRRFSFSIVGGETEEPEKFVGRIRGAFEAALDGRFKRRDVERTRRKMAGKYLRAFDSPESAAFLLLGCAMRELDPFAVPRAIGRLTPQALGRRLRKHFRPENLAVSTVVPK
ncbi:MAG: EF-P 5-aminopentanol modification-associated protein YfmH [Planctomycetota bacterium]